MPSLFKTKRSAGAYLAVAMVEGRVDLVAVRRQPGAPPHVALAESVERGTDDVATLTALNKSLKLGGYRCIALLEHGKYQLLQTEAPDEMAGATSIADETKEIVRWRVKDQVDFPVDAAAIDLLPIPVTGRAPQIFAALAPESAMTPLVQAFQAAKLDLTIVDLPELSQRNLATLFEEPERGLACLVFDDREGQLSFTTGGELLVMRHVEIPVRQLINADTDRREMLFERIALDVQRSLDNFDRLFSAAPLSRLLVAPIPGVEGFIDYLSANLTVPVAAMDISTVLDLGAVPALLDPVRRFQCLRALGAALRDEGSA